MDKQRYSSLKKSFDITIEIAGKKAPIFKRSLALFIVAFTAQGIGFALFFPLLEAIFQEVPNLEEAKFWLINMAICAGVYLVAKWFAHSFDYSGHLVDITHDIRIKLGDKIKSMPLEKLFSYRTGELNSTLSTSVEHSVLHMGVIAGLLLETIITPLVLLIAVFIIDFRMGIALVLMFPVAHIIYKSKRTGSLKEKEDLVNEARVLESDIIEYVQGVPVLRSLNQIGENAKALQQSIYDVGKIQRKNLNSAVLPMMLMTTLIEFVLILVLILGAFWIANGSFAISSLIAMVIILTRVSEPLSLFLALTSVLDIMEAAFIKIKEILDTKDLPVKALSQKLHKFDIEFKDVDFAYLGHNTTALNGVNFTIKENTLTAIVGPSGSGKTTITKLIMRYADPQRGAITIGGVDIKDVKAKDLLKNISVVFQDVYLFDDTILNNIRMGKPSATNKEVKDAAKKAFCHEFIERLPHGYETKVGEIGGTLSGGERQRISIARAILKDSPIVILDEPTSALDTESEVAVQKAIDALVKNRTVIVIAHRLSTITGSDLILVVEDGKILEQGEHEKLVANKNRYYNMFSAQQRIKEWNLNKEVSHA